MNFRRSASALILLIALSLICFAQNPAIDPGFVPALSQSSTSLTFTQAIQPDGKIVYAGNFQVANGAVRYGVARLNVDGTVDATFSCQVCATFTSYSVFAQADGKILVSGYRGNGSPEVMVRLNADGSQDNSFQYIASPTNQQSLLSVKGVLPNGKIMVILRRQPNPSNDIVFRLNADGTKDNTFNQIVIILGPVSTIDVRVLPDGRVFTLGNNAYGNLALLNDDGSKNTSFASPALGSPSSSASVGDVALQSDGRLVFTGFFNSVNGVSKVNAARLNTDQSVDTTFGQQLTNGYISQIIPVSNNKFIIKGNPNVLPQIIQRLNSDGSNDATFTPPAGANYIYPVYIDSTERIYNYTNRYNADGTTDTTYFALMELAGSASALVRQNDGKILISGSFERANGLFRKSIARLNADGLVDASFDTASAFNFVITDIGLQSDNKILAVGNFTHNGIAKGIVRLNSNGSLDTSFDTNTGASPGIGGGVYDVEVLADGKILIGGEFTAINGQTRNGLARLNSDGSLDASFDVQLAAGSKIRKVVVQADGKIMIAGSFAGVNGVSRSNLARLNGNGTLDASFDANVGAAVKVIMQPDGKYLAASNTLVYRLNSDGSADNSFASPVLSGNPFIMDLALLNDGSVVMGGVFSTVNGLSKRNIVRLASNGAVDTAAFSTGANSSVTRLFKLPDGNLIAAGGFTLIEDKPRTGVAKLVMSLVIGSKLFDFDGDGRADISVTRPAAAYVWYQLRGSNYTFTQTNFGQSGDIVTPADFDGDGKTDIAIFRPSNGQWWYISSVDGLQKSVTSGAAGDIPMPADFTGDGKADFVLYRPSTGQWWRQENGGSTVSNIFFGSAGDKPVMGDFDGDGKVDVAVFRPSTGVFWYAASSQGNAFRAFQWGIATDVPAVADYDGDGKTDFAIYRPSNGVWWIYNSSTGTTSNVTWGAAEDKPVAADYDGDGKADTAVYRPSNGTWYILSSSAGFSGFQWGIATDVPSPGAFVP